MKPILTAELLCEEARIFAEIESTFPEPNLYGVTDGKAVGTYFEHKFQNFLREKYIYEVGSSAKGIDFPQLGIDMKVTSVKQPQSSCPFRSARQKMYGLGYSLIVFVYKKWDDPETATGRLDVLHVIYVAKDRTADFQTTSGLVKILENDGNKDDVLAFMQERMIPVDDVQANQLADEIMENPPKIGYLTISNALQWRLQYSRVIQKAGEIEGIIRVA